MQNISQTAGKIR